MSALLLVIAIVCFCVRAFGGHIGSMDLLALGLAFFAAACLIGPVALLIKKVNVS